MPISRNTILAAAVSLLVGLWGGVTLAQWNGGPGDKGRAENVRSAKAPRAQAISGAGMEFLRARIDTTGDAPKACLEFSQDLVGDGSVRYADYLGIEPAARAETSVAGKLLCLTGLPFEPDRAVTIKAGLPGVGGAALAQDESFTLSFGERPTFVGFAGQGVILPRAEADGLGIETVNVTQLKVSVLRVSDRNIARQALEEGQAVPEGSYSYWDFQYAGQDLGAPVYEGKIAVDLGPSGSLEGRRNQTITSVFPLGAAMKRVKPGAYVVKVEDISPSAGARGEQNRPAAAYRWIIYTDLALQTFKGSQGMDIVVRSLESARPQSGITLAVLAQNNDELGRAKTNGQGRASFAAPLFQGEGAQRARYIVAYGREGDFTALDLERSPIDLSDRDIAGRNVPPQIDAFVYTDRGIYRPGETVRLGALVRDAGGKAVENRKSVLVLTRPNGTEARRQRLLEADQGGAILKNLAIDRGAPRGRWSVKLLVDGQETPAGEASFAVEDFVPQRLKVAIAADDAPFTGGGSRAIPITASFLYGAVGAGLPVQGEARLVRDPNPFPDFAKFHFGKAEDGFEDRSIPLNETVTDGAGKAQLALVLPEVETSLPLRALVSAAVLEPGGRAVREQVNIPVRLSGRYFGLRPTFEGGYAGENTPLAFEVLALDRAGKRLAQPDLAWSLIEEDYGYDWYLEDGQWKWRRTGRDIPRSAGKVQIAANAPAGIPIGALKSGSYRLEVQADGVQSSYRFGVGWGGGAGDRDTPDVVAVAAPNEPVRPGGMAHLEIKSPYPGQAQVIIATDRVISSRTLQLSNQPTKIDLKADESWGAGAYVLVTVVTARDPKAAPVPRRAIGLTYVPVDMSARTLKVSLAPELKKLRPQQKLELPIEIKGAAGREPVRVTLSAVDEGILQLTRFAAPDPVAHYFGRKALGVELRDDYGRLLNPNLGAPVNPNQGGDAIGGEGLSVVPQKTVALWSGLVSLDRQGRGVITLDPADLNGAIRLMAVAWTRSSVGSASSTVVVRDPVVADLTLPRFLAPGDDAQATLLLDNVEGPAGSYVATLTGEGAAQLKAAPISVQLAQGEQRVVRMPIQAGANGLGQVRVQLTGPNGYSVARNYPIEARAPFLPYTLTETQAQAPGAVFATSSDLFSPFAPGTGEAWISYSALRGLDPVSLISSLDRYPYGCTEQLVSRALPLLLAQSMAAAGFAPADAQSRARVQEAVNAILDRQGPDGALGLWRAGDGAASPWLGAYAVDFLRRAKAAGLIVPDAPLELSYKALRAVARLDDFASVGYDFEVFQWAGSDDTQELLKSRAAAYALYVLAKAKRADVGQLRYFADAKLKNEPSPLAKAQIGAALAYLGDRARSRAAFTAAEKALGYKNNSDYYQSELRDVAWMTALAAEAGEQELSSRLARRLERQTPDLDRISTQEQAGLLTAADTMLQSAGPVQISRDGGPAGSLSLLLKSGDALGQSFKNVGKGQVFRTLTRYGAPASPPPAAAQGFSMQKQIYRLDGSAANLAKLVQGDRLVIVLRGTSQDERTHPAIAVDLLPAGLEIETVLRSEDGRATNAWDDSDRSGAFGWVGEITASKAAEARDDRFVAAADVRGGFAFAYVVRAVTPGSYALPGVQMEDMYRPEVFGRSAPARVTIAAQNR